jgi:hypothetical protein
MFLTMLAGQIITMLAIAWPVLLLAESHSGMPLLAHCNRFGPSCWSLELIAPRVNHLKHIFIV